MKLNAWLPLLGALQGLSVTLRNFFRRNVTVQYPEERGSIPERFRGRLFLDPNICIGCTMCEQACPNGALVMVPWGKIDNVSKPQERDYNLFPQVDIAMCTYCGWCEDVCPTGAIRHTQQFELARYIREGDVFVYTPERLSKSEEELLREAEPTEVEERPKPEEKPKEEVGVAGR
jgi:NADH-quinone oxidoreductase subunit I